MRAEILSYSRSRGLFAGVSLEGSTLRPDIPPNEIPPNEPRFGPKYPTFLPHVTLGRAYDEWGFFPVPLRTSARRVTLPESVTFRTQHVHVVHYAYRSLLRCVGDMRIALDTPPTLDSAALADHLHITST
jgi:hypothetical protein